MSPKMRGGSRPAQLLVYYPESDKPAADRLPVKTTDGGGWGSRLLLPGPFEIGDAIQYNAVACARAPMRATLATE
ncbi:MAG: hypothetical protein ACREYE_10435 [Gammaproteobacteria bacterium]